MRIALEISYPEATLRLAMAVLLCGLVGLERQFRAQPAGMRTHILVGLGACLFTLISAYGFTEAHTVTHGAGGRMVMTPVDPTRIAAQVVSGIGFLGGGAILRQGFNVRGLTTAAALWIAAAIGMACGAGMYFEAGVATVIVLGSLVTIRWMNTWLNVRFQRDLVHVDLDLSKDKRLAQFLTVLCDADVEVRDLHTEESGDEHSERRVSMMLRLPSQMNSSDVAALVDEFNGMSVVTVESSAPAASASGALEDAGASESPDAKGEPDGSAESEGAAEPAIPPAEEKAAGKDSGKHRHGKRRPDTPGDSRG